MSRYKRSNLLPVHTLAAAETGATTSAYNIGAAKYLTARAKFVRAAGGTTTKVWIQTSLDGGTTWFDIMCLAFTTTTATKVSAVTTTTALAAASVPTDGTMADDIILSGLLGDLIRVKYTTTGTYTGASSLTVDIVAKD